MEFDWGEVSHDYFYTPSNVDSTQLSSLLKSYPLVIELGETLRTLKFARFIAFNYHRLRVMAFIALREPLGH